MGLSAARSRPLPLVTGAGNGQTGDMLKVKIYRLGVVVASFALLALALGAGRKWS